MGKKYKRISELNQNLWNVDYSKRKTNTSKTRDVVIFIKSLNFPSEVEDTDRAKERRFNSIIEEALSASTANEMLEIIGYSPTGKHGIFDLVYI